MYPLVYAGMYAGDAVIHLVFGENASHGHLFEFNMGEHAAGVTSPGYMLFLAALFRIMPNDFVPLAAKIVCVVCWYVLLLLVFKLSSLLIGDELWVWIVTMICGLLPGSAYNSTIGMENGIFGLVVILYLYLMVSWEWFAPGNGTVKNWRELVIGILLGIGTWIRPEGLAMGVLAILIRLLGPKRKWRILLPVLTAIPFLILVGLLIGFHYYYTGQLLPSSAKSRIVMGHVGSLAYGPIMLNLKFFIRSLIYLPITLFFVIGTIKCLERLIAHTGILENSREAGLLYCTVSFALFFVLYSTVLGSAHLGRYVIFLMPLMVIVGGYGASWTWQNWNCSRLSTHFSMPCAKTLAFAALAVFLLCVFVAETYMRLHLGGHDGLCEAMKAPKSRRQFSENFLLVLGNPKEFPVSLGVVEVQVRYWLDNRFIVRSLDGRVDDSLLEHFRDGNFDHPGYIKDRRIDFITEFPNYNKDASLWSLARLTQLNVGQTVQRQGVVFTCLKPGIIRCWFSVASDMTPRNAFSGQ